jgi:hypothetical protein
MKRAILILLAVLLATASAYAQNAPPSPIVFIIQPSQQAGITATTTTRATTNPSSNNQNWRFCDALNILLNITSGGTATATLQIYLQDSVDGGTTWDDLVSSNTFAFGAAATTQRFFVSTYVAPSATQGTAVVLEALAAGTVRQGPYGDRIRVREKVTGPSGSPVGPTYTITAACRQ